MGVGGSRSGGPQVALCGASLFPWLRIQGGSRNLQVRSPSPSIQSAGCGQLLLGEVAQERSSCFPSPPSIPWLRFAVELWLWAAAMWWLTFLRQSLREEAILGACAGREDAGGAGKSWVAGAGADRTRGLAGGSSLPRRSPFISRLRIEPPINTSKSCLNTLSSSTGEGGGLQVGDFT